MTVLLLLIAALSPQAAEATLRVTVVDPSGAVIVGATVQVVHVELMTSTVLTDGRGEALFEHVPPGRYAVRVESPGFEPHEIADLRLRSGRNRRVVKLSLAKIAQTITVDRDPRERASDPRGDAFTTLLLPHQIEQLPDDPDEMARVLLDLAGPGATMRVNGFRSNRLPPKDQIQHVRFRRNAFAADTHDAGGVFVDVVTKPGGELWRGTSGAGFRLSALDARSALAVRKEDASLQRYSLSLNGPLWREHTSLSLAIDATSAVDARTIRAWLPDRQVADVSTRPIRAHTISGRIEQALARGHVLRVELDHASGRTDRAGVGDFDLPERGYRQRTRGHGVRASASGAVGRIAYNEVRVQIREDAASFLPESTAPAVLVLNAFNSGGAQISGARSSRQFELADDLDIARGNHALRAGVVVEGVRVASDVARNATGTFTFASLDAFRAGRATTFARNVGDPRTMTTLTQWGVYLQDDYRARKNLTLSAGTRYELQSIVGSWQWAPRASVVWAPFASGRTTVRAGGGVFFDWFDAQSYEYVRQLDGMHQQIEVVVDPDADAILLPPGRVRLSPHLKQPRLVQASIGLEQRVATDIRLHAIWTTRHGTLGLRGLNVNAPVAGLRPDPASGPIVEIDSSARSKMDSVTVQSTYSPGGRPVFASVSYTWSRSTNETDGPTSVPADARDLASEWGPSLDDVRHRVTALFSTPIVRRIRFGVSMRVQSGSPYNITTGADDNGDTTSNDRPAGVTRNSARGAGQADVNARLAWTFGFGRRSSTSGAPAVLARTKGDGDALAAFGSAADVTKRYNVELYAQAFNLLNRVNVTSYSGVSTSPVFGQPIAVGPPRRIEFGVRVRF